MFDADDLLQVRRYSTPNYNCPKHISIDACLALFSEAGVDPEPKAVGCLGDILENFALALLKDARGAMTRDSLAERLRRRCD